MATIRNIAKEASVSIATVSRVLNDSESVSSDLRDRVQRVAERMGRSAGRKSSGQFIALAYTGRISLGSPYDAAILQAVSEVAEDNGFDLAILRLENESRNNESWSQLMQRKGVQGLILRTHADSRHLCLEIARENFPHIVVGERFEAEGDVNYVRADSGPTSRQAVDHLISLGHRRIAIALSHVDDADHADRLGGYLEALKANDISVDEQLICRVWAKKPNGEQLIRNLMSLPDRPTALFITDPFLAIGAINKAHQIGVRIPEDVSIIGFDDAEMRGTTFPPLSAVCQDAHRIGYEAANTLVRAIQGNGDGQARLTLPTILELHRTTGPAPLHRVRILPNGTRVEDIALTNTSVREASLVGV